MLCEPGSATSGVLEAKDGRSGPRSRRRRLRTCPRGCGSGTGNDHSRRRKRSVSLWRHLTWRASTPFTSAPPPGRSTSLGWAMLLFSCKVVGRIDSGSDNDNSWRLQYPVGSVLLRTLFPRPVYGPKAHPTSSLLFDRFAHNRRRHHQSQSVCVCWNRADSKLPAMII